MRRAFLGIVIIAVSSVPSLAQEKEIRRSSLPENNSLDVLFASLERALREEEYETSSEVLRSIERFFDKHGDGFVVRLGSVYYGARLLLLRRLASIPDNAVDNFAPIFLNTELLLKRAERNPNLAKRVFGRPASRSQLERALRILIPYLLERGEFVEALRTIESAELILDELKDETLKFYSALCNAFSRRQKEARRRLRLINAKIGFKGEMRDPNEVLEYLTKNVRLAERMMRRMAPLPPGLPHSIPVNSVFNEETDRFATSVVLPVRIGDSVIINTGKEVCRLNRDGKLWSVPLVTDSLRQAYLYSRIFRPSTDEWCVYFTDRERVRAHSIDDGSFVWSSDPIKDVVVLSSPTISGSDVYVYALIKKRELKATVFCFDKRTGRQKWFTTVATGFPKNPFNSAVVALPPIAYGGRVFIISSFEVFCALSKDGRILWAYRYPKAFENLTARLTAEGRRKPPPLPLICGNRIVAIPPDSLFIVAFSTTEPKMLWRLPTEAEWSINGLCGIDDRRVAAFGTELLILDSETGLIDEFIELPVRVDTGICGAEALWLLSSRSRCLLRVKEESLKVFFLPELRRKSVLSVVSGRLFIVSPYEVLFFKPLRKEDGELYALRTGDIDPTRNPRFYEMWRKGILGAFFSRGMTLDTALMPIIEYHREREPLKTARILDGLSESVRPERAGSLLLDAASVYLHSRHYEEALKTLAKAPLLSAEAVSLGSLGYLPMPHTSASLALLLSKRLKEESLEKFQRKAAEILTNCESLSDLESLFFAYPYTDAGSSAALDVARRLITSKRTKRAEEWLLSIIHLPISTTLRLEALKLLLHIYQSVGDKSRADWTRNALITVERSSAVPQPDAPLWLPLKIAWRSLPYLVVDEEMDATVVKVGGRAFVLRFGETVIDAVDAENGSLLWRLGLEQRESRPVQREDGKILLLSGETLAVIDGKEGEILKRIRVSGLDEISRREASVRLFPLDGSNVCLLDGAGNVIFVDAERGRIINRTRLIQGRVRSVLQVGSRIAVLEDTLRILLLDLRKGIVVGVIKPGTNEVILDVRAGDGRLYLLLDSQQGQSICAYTDAGKLLWRKRLNNPASGVSVLSDGLLVLPERTSLKPTFSMMDTNGVLRWSYSFDAPLLWFKTTECRERLLILVPKGDGNSECIVIEVGSGVEKERITLGINDVGLFFSSGNFAVALEDSFYLPSVAIIDVRRASAVGTLLFLNGLIKTALSAAGRIIVMSATGTTVALGSDIYAAADAASAAARLLLAHNDTDAVCDYAVALTLLGETDAPISALSSFYRSNTLYDRPRQMGRLQALLAETAFTSALRSAPVVDVPYTPYPPNIDGSPEDEWQRAKVIELTAPKHLLPIQRKDILAYRWFAEEDLSARLYLMWDEKAFYALLDVSDQSQRPFDDSDTLHYKGDMLYVAVENVLIYVGLMVPKPKKKGEDEERSKPKGKYMVKTKSDNSGFIYELSMPWDYLMERGVRLKGKTPSSGDSFRLNFAVVDDDTGFGAEKSLNLAPGLCCGRRDVIWRGFTPKAFATAVLRR